MSRRQKHVFFAGTFAAGTYRKAVGMYGFDNIMLSFVTALSGVADASLKVYVSTEDYLDVLLTDTNPATNPEWIEDIGAVFASDPGIVASGFITLEHQPYASMMLEMVVVNPITIRVTCRGAVA